MRTIGLELCDAGAYATAEEAPDSWLIPLENSGTSSPGFVYYDGERYICGQQAENRSRIYPRYVADNGWDQLSLRVSDITVAGNSPFYSELAYHHLQHVWKRIITDGPVGKAVVALPSNFLATTGDEKKTGLVLGMIQDLEIPLAGIIDMAAASLVGHTATVASDNLRALHLDVHQRTSIVTAFDLSPSVRRRHVASVPIGFSQVYNEITPKLANRFLSLTAFDVTHDAETEQQFYNQVKILLAFLKDHEAVTLEMGGTRRPRKMEVYRDVAARHLDPISDLLIQLLDRSCSEAGMARSAKMTLYLTDRASGIPGLAEKLAHRENMELVFLPSGAASHGAALIGVGAELIKNLEETPLTTEFDPVTIGVGASVEEESEPAAAAPALPEVKVLPPTHIVYSGHAHRIQPTGLELRNIIPGGGHGLRIKIDGESVILENYNSSNTLLNHHPADSSERLKAGDVLTLRGENPEGAFDDVIVIRCDE